MPCFRKYFLVLIILHFSFFIFYFAQATSLTHVSDKISTSWPSVGADHTLRFIITTPVPNLGKIIITPEDGFFNIPSDLDYTDLDFILNGVGKNLASSPTETKSGVEVISGTSGKIIITLAKELSLFLGDEVIIRIGKNAIHQTEGNRQIINPSGDGSYKINIQTLDSSLNLLDRADAMIAILNPVQIGLKVKVIAFCGNGTVEEGEQCDGSDLAGQTCESLGYAGGTLSCNPDCTFDTSGCTIERVAPEALLPAVPTKVILEGWAYPQSKITALKDGQIVKIVYANSRAEFRVEISDLTPGIYTFSLWAEDKDGRRSITYSLTFYVRAETTTTISGIFLPPTIDLSKTALLRGEILDIFGQTVPNSEVEIRIYSPGEEIIEKTAANEMGVWLLSFNTQPLEEGSHLAKSRSQISEDTISGFGYALSFMIGKPPIFIPDGDLNNDDKVNLIDFSILIYWWGRPNVIADQNQDGIVNLPDFSILLYYWTG